ncbi:MAG: hypothetical protein RL160_687 [Bacteroidota bacterium]|jgi:branched-chain amino acid aminotransferase
MQINFNGTLHSEDDPLFPASSRVHRYGDGFFESIRASSGHLLHFNHHMHRIRKSAMLLGVVLDSRFEEQRMEQEIQRTLKAASLSHARVRLTVFREGKGFYLPLEEQACYLIEVSSLETPFYPLATEGLLLGDYRELVKNSNFTSMLKTNAALLYVMASLHARRNGFHECVLYNEQGRVAEAINANIFKVDGNKLITPPLSEYGVDGVMRMVVMDLARSYGYDVFEQPITANDLIASDELFLTSAVSGIRWVREYQGKRFKNPTAKMLHQLLNKAIPGYADGAS